MGLLQTQWEGLGKLFGDVFQKLTDADALAHVKHDFPSDQDRDRNYVFAEFCIYRKRTEIHPGLEPGSSEFRERCSHH